MTKKIAKRLLEKPLNAKYTSHNIQNELLETMANVVREQIIDEVKKSQYFSVMVDESKDVSKTEQISIVLRFYNQKQIHECFVDFKAATGLDALSLSTIILDSLRSYGLDVTSCLVGQGYDGASVMSGCHSGVQQRIRDSAPLAYYVHCYAHRLNLVIVDCCKSVAEVRDFLLFSNDYMCLFRGHQCT